jgi:uncharacterized membrane protein YkoI
MMQRYGVLIGCMVAAILFLGVAGCKTENEGAEGKAEAKKEAKEEAKVELPAAAAAAIKAAFPDAEIEEVEVEEENGLTLYEVELEQGDVEMEVEVDADGTLAEIETEIALKDVPEAVLQAIQAADADAKIEEIEKVEIRAEIKTSQLAPAAQLVKLAEPRIVYEAELKKGDKEGEITVAADGKVVEPLKWEEKEEGEKEEGENEDEDE